MLRRTQGTKATMAGADNEDITAGVEVDYRDSEQELERPIMPHLLFNDHELNSLYPSFSAPEAVDNEDINNDDAEPTLQYGWRLASEICREMEVLGRTRRQAFVRDRPLTTTAATTPLTATTTTTTTTAKPTTTTQTRPQLRLQRLATTTQTRPQLPQSNLQE